MLFRREIIFSSAYVIGYFEVVGYIFDLLSIGFKKYRNTYPKFKGRCSDIFARIDTVSFE